MDGEAKSLMTSRYDAIPCITTTCNYDGNGIDPKSITWGCLEENDFSDTIADQTILRETKVPSQSAVREQLLFVVDSHPALTAVCILKNSALYLQLLVL